MCPPFCVRAPEAVGISGMPDSFQATPIATRPRRRWSAQSTKQLLNVFLAGYALSSAYGANTNPAYARPDDLHIAMTALIVSVAVPSVTWLLLELPAVRRRALSVRFVLVLVIVGAVVNAALHREERVVTIPTALCLVGPAIALLLAHRRVRLNREELAARRHQELVEAARMAALTQQVRGLESSVVQQGRGTLRSRARRQR